MGFTTFTMEAGSAGTEPINDYVLHGTGDLGTALTGQGYTAWDTEEITAMIEKWIRRYNTGVPANRKVQFIGLDIFLNARGRARVLDYL